MAVLKQRISSKVARMKLQKNYGLVFEEHLPKPLRSMTFRNKNSSVAEKDGFFKVFYRVKQVEGDMLICETQDDKYEEVIMGKSCKWAMSALLLMLGIGIYILFRPQNILVFGLIDDLGLMPIVNSLRMHASSILLPSFVINSVPAGLWTASYLIAMYLATSGASRTQRLVLSIPLPITAIILEFFQLFGWCSGTFDFYDLLCYIIPLIVFIKTI